MVSKFIGYGSFSLVILHDRVIVSSYDSENGQGCNLRLCYLVVSYNCISKAVMVVAFFV